MYLNDYTFDVIGFTLSAGLSYIVYRSYKSSKVVVENLKDTLELDVNAKLISMLTEHGGTMLAAIRGTVKAIDAPLVSLKVPDVVGVVRRTTIKEHLVTQAMGYWRNDKRTIDSTMSSVPFTINDKGIGVQLCDPSQLDHVHLTVVSDKFEMSGNSLGSFLLNWLQGVHTMGTQHKEKMLLEGTRVMGLGRLNLKNDEIYLDFTDEIPYIITTKDLKTICEEYQSYLPLLRIGTVIFGSISVYFGYRLLRQWYRKWRLAWERHQEQQVMEEARVRREQQDLPESYMCVVCGNLRDVVLMPCRHVCVCGECAQRLEPRVCPVCRTPIDRLQPVFYS